MSPHFDVWGEFANSAQKTGIEVHKLHLHERRRGKEKGMIRRLPEASFSARRQLCFDVVAAFMSF